MSRFGGAVIRGAAIAGLVLVASSAAADRAAVDAARVDWAAGRVTAGGTGVADRHAPSPAVALGTSRRGAEQSARQRIAAMLASLPLASGGTVGDKLSAAGSGGAGGGGASGAPVSSLRARLDAAVDAAIAIDAEPETDGSWHVTMAVPLEAIRLAIDEPRALPAAGDADPPVLIVDGVTGKPAVGWTINGAPASTLWIKDLPAWAKAAPHMTAASAGQGAITIDGKAGGPATLYLLSSGK